MADFFIDRPVFAWVISLFIMLAGALSIFRLPIAQYPSIAPPSVVITATYPGATAAVLDESVTSLIEEELNGAEGLIYIESQSQANGIAQITAYFETGTNPDLAAVDVQNRLKRVEARLPAAVTQQGVQVNKATSNFLLIASLVSTDGRLDPIALGDYISRNVLDEILRVPGVGDARLFGTEQAMRVWIDPVKLVGLELTPADITAAIRGQNAQVTSGTLGDRPNLDDQATANGVVITGQLNTPEEFGNILLRANPDGSVVRLRDVARIEIGGQTYAFSARLNGKPTSVFGVLLSPNANALATAKGVKTRFAELSAHFPEGVAYDFPFDSSRFVEISIKGVVETLLEAIVLVVLVMFLFMQNWRATLIPAIAVPVALMGAFATMLALGFSINVLTMFGLVLAIGILVDDAIVVVENVERIMSEEGLPAREATHKAMGQITGAIVGITLVLTSVFIPMAFFSGSVGAIYRQFSLSLAASMIFSAIMALSLTPALCAALLKPIEPGHNLRKRGFFGWFNRGFNHTTQRYQGSVARILRRTGRFMLIYAVIIACAAFLYLRLPSAFLPTEDQGVLLTNIQLPADASSNRTAEVVEKVEQFYLQHPAVEKMVSVTGFSFVGSGQNAAVAFITLKDWAERGSKESAQAIAAQANATLSQIRDAIVFALIPPPIPELGTATGFNFRLQDRGGLGHQALTNARNQLLGMAAKNPVLAGVRPEGLEDSPQLELLIDREKASALGVSFADLNNLVSTALGSTYVNDFPNQGRQQRVIVQADAARRMQPSDVMNLYLRNAQGQMVSVSTFAQAQWITGPMQLTRYNGYPAIKIAGDAAPGYSTGEAMDAMEQMAGQLQPGIAYEWTGQSREEKESGAQASALFMLSLLAVFLCLAALYESWSIPASVMMVVPLGALGALLGVTLRGIPDDVYFKVGLIAVIGLSAKNAILIIEFAKDLQAEGMDLIDATLEAVKLRFRPIIMTSLAFIMGVVPLVVASGAGSASQRAIGTAVMGGMIAATVLAVFLVPVFFVVIRRIFKGRGPRQPHPGAHIHANPSEEQPTDDP
jgi:multidrug efflux pump